MTSLRRVLATWRIDDVLAVLFSLALLVLGATHTSSLQHRSLLNFAGLILYYAGMFLFARWLVSTPRAGPWLRRSVFAALCALLSFFALGTRVSPGIQDVKNAIVLILPLVIGAWTAPGGDSDAADSSQDRPTHAPHGLLRDLAPFLISQAAYIMLHDLVHAVNPTDRDAWLIRADQILFGGAWTQRLEPYVHPWLTEWFSMTYSLYLLFPVSLALWFVARRQRDALLHLLQAVVLCTYLGYLGYLAVPAIGPLYTLTYHVPLSGGWFSEIRESLDSLARIPRDCFPSLHTANTVVVLWIVWKHAPTLRWIFTILGSSCIAATIYLRYHYTVDVAAGLLLGLLVAWSTPHIDTAWRRVVSPLAQTRPHHTP